MINKNLIARIFFKYHTVLAGIILSIAAFGVFSNNYDHAYNLDSANMLKDNRYVRDLKNIPLYFQDPTTLTSNRANADYRPILQITYALNYYISKYNTWSWHLVQIILHIICAIGLFCFVGKIIEQFIVVDNPAEAFVIPFIISLLFVVTPVLPV